MAHQQAQVCQAGLQLSGLKVPAAVAVVAVEHSARLPGPHLPVCHLRSIHDAEF